MIQADEILPPILVADDNPTDVFFLQRRLFAAGLKHPLEHVGDGNEAIRWLERRLANAATEASRPWLVFVDLKMPCADGFEVLRWIQQNDAAHRLTVAVLTTSDEPIDLERAKRLGAHRYLLKYPNPSDLLQLATDAMRRAFGEDSLLPGMVGSGVAQPNHA